MITMELATWNELKAKALALAEIATERTTGSMQDTALAMEGDLIWLLGEVDDANTRAAYMALAADDQMSLFDVEGAAI
jgi:hypothetical protein